MATFQEALTALQTELAETVAADEAKVASNAALTEALAAAQAAQAAADAGNAKSAQEKAEDAAAYKEVARLALEEAARIEGGG